MPSVSYVHLTLWFDSVNEDIQGTCCRLLQTNRGESGRQKEKKIGGRGGGGGEGGREERREGRRYYGQTDQSNLSHLWTFSMALPQRDSEEEQPRWWEEVRKIEGGDGGIWEGSPGWGMKKNLWCERRCEEQKTKNKKQNKYDREDGGGVSVWVSEGRRRNSCISHSAAANWLKVRAITWCGLVSCLCLHASESWRQWVNPQVLHVCIYLYTCV